MESPQGEPQKSPGDLVRGGWLALVLGGLTLLLFAPVVGYDYLQYDDGIYVYENGEVAKGLSWSGLAYAFRSFDGGSWMPLTWLSLMLDRTLFGPVAWGHHLTNV